MSERWVPFDVTDAATSPFVQFARWYEEGRELLREPDAVVVATADEQGSPHARYVLLRVRTDVGYGFFTNYESRKGRDLLVNPRAALLWYCEPLGRQVRLEGSVAPMTDAESDAYFHSRPRGHQIGAHASAQSREIASRDDLERRVAELTEEFGDAEIPRPPHWGGYLLTPQLFEFWQHRQDRLHDRVIYEPTPDGSWRRVRWAP